MGNVIHINPTASQTPVDETGIVRFPDGTCIAELGRLVDRISNLPVFPNAGLKLIETFKSPSYNFRQISEIIASDVGMATRVLSMANSSFYGVRNRITTVNHAVTMLGAEEVENLAMTLCFLHVARGRSHSDAAFSPTRFIEHSMFVGRIAQFLAEKLGLQLVGRGEAYTVGLLHDVGLFVLYRYHLDRLKMARQHAVTNKIPYVDAELQSIGVSHAALGAQLAHRWNLPLHFCHAIAYHHCHPPRDVVLPELLALVRLCDQVAIAMGVKTSVDEDIEDLDPVSLELLIKRGLPDNTVDLVETIIVRYKTELEEVYESLERMLRGPDPEVQGGAGGRTVADLERRLNRSERKPAPDSMLSRFRRWFGI